MTSARRVVKKQKKKKKRQFTSLESIAEDSKDVDKPDLGSLSRARIKNRHGNSANGKCSANFRDGFCYSMVLADPGFTSV